MKSIERETELSGPLHSKGVLILAGYLAATYAQERPLALAATITFEQSYDEVEGDSASCAELCALLSALSGVPISRASPSRARSTSTAVVQAVGGVTPKIEGFFDACREQGITGRQGMVIPAANVGQPDAEQDEITAARAGRFKIWPVASVDKALAIVTGRDPVGGAVTAPSPRRPSTAWSTTGCVHMQRECVNSPPTPGPPRDG